MRFGSVIRDKDKLSGQEGQRQRLMLRRSNMMTWKSGEIRDCTFYLMEKNLRRKLRLFDELAWKRKMCSIDSFSWRETGVVFGSSPEPKHHQREVGDPVGAAILALRADFRDQRNLSIIPLL